jgi:hypothetical protein
VLKVSAAEWIDVAKQCEISPALLLQRSNKPSHSVALDILNCLWQKEAFRYAHESADEIAILADQGSSTVKEHYVLHQKYYNKKPRGRRLEIVVSARFFGTRHKFCLNVTSRYTEITPWGDLCTCGCRLRSSELKNPAQPQCRQAQVSPVTLLRDLGLVDARAIDSNISNQAKLVQYFMPNGRGQITYVDYFDHFSSGDGSFLLETLDSWTDAFVYAAKRHKTAFWKARDAYYKKILRSTKDKVTATGLYRGTVYVAYKKLLLASQSALWATYNVKESFDNVQLLAAAFAEFTDHPSMTAAANSRGGRRSMVKIKQANKSGEFHAIKWRDITLFDLVHLVATENSNNAPSIETLYSAIVGGNGNNGDCEKILLVERVLSHRLCWLHNTFECEWASSPSWSLTGMSYSAVMHSVHSDARQVGLEQFGHAYSMILHAHNQGGLMLSSAPSLASGDALGSK